MVRPWCPAVCCGFHTHPSHHADPHFTICRICRLVSLLIFYHGLNRVRYLLSVHNDSKKLGITILCSDFAVLSHAVKHDVVYV